MKEIIISENTKDQRLNKFLERLLCNAGSGFIYKMLRKKNITLNGKQAKGNEMLAAGDIVRIYFSDETFEKFTASADPETEELQALLEPERIVYEDPNILIYNKPAGLLSQRAKGDEPSACEQLVGYLMQKDGIDRDSLREYRPSAINRLDRNTTGLLVCAKKLAAAQQLSQVFKDRTVKKEYICLVKGRVTKKAERKGYLHKDESTNTVTISSEKNGGSIIETAYTPIKFCDKLDASVLLVDLKTGKTHQIRAHLAAEGFPVAGDRKYGDSEWNEKLYQAYHVKHQLLHAYRIQFPKMSGTLAYLSNREFCTEPPFQSIYED